MKKKYLKIIPPEGYPVVVPDDYKTRRHYEKLNEMHAKEKDGKKYVITEATDEDIASFNPILSKKESSQTTTDIRDIVNEVINTKEIGELKLKAEADNKRIKELEAEKVEAEKVKEKAKADAKRIKELEAELKKNEKSE